MRSIDQDIQNAPLKAYLRTLILQTVKKYVFQSYQSPSGPVYTRKTLQVFWIHKDCFIWTWHFKTTRRVKTSGMHLSRRIYVPLFSKPLRNICFSPTSHLLALSAPEKHYNFFGFTTVWFEHENTLHKKLKYVSCDHDRLNGWNSTLQAAWYIRYVRLTCLFYISFIIYGFCELNLRYVY